MKIYTSYKDIKEADHGAVVTIGNFDGLHRGHQILIAKAKEKALELGTKLAVLSFTPHPRLFFKADQPPFLLTRDTQKADLLKTLCGVDIFYNLPFDTDFAALSAQDFILKVLVSGFGARHIVIGHDFCFGAMRQGNAETLQAHSDFGTTIIPQLSNDKGTVFSSSEIRNALRRGDIESANHLLGWDWHIEGEVIHGDKRGRELGYPTANMDLGAYLCPAYGVYAVRVQIEGETQWRSGASNIGVRPMFKLQKPLLETYIFDFDNDLYGKTLKVKPVKFLRGEARFEDLDALKAQMARDCAKAREIMKAHPASPAAGG